MPWNFNEQDQRYNKLGEYRYNNVTDLCMMMVIS